MQRLADILPKVQAQLWTNFGKAQRDDRGSGPISTSDRAPGVGESP
jgi:hypothetical protein